MVTVSKEKLLHILTLHRQHEINAIVAIIQGRYGTDIDHLTRVIEARKLITTEFNSSTMTITDMPLKEHQDDKTEEKKETQFKTVKNSNR